MYLRGVPLKQIAADLDITLSYAQRRAKLDNLPRRTRAREQTTAS